jgi:hypothetical protein
MDSLPEGDSGRLKLASLEAYQKSLSDRDLVAVYSPKARPGDATAASDSKADDAANANFSGTVGNGVALQAWIRTTGETLRLAAGDALKVGTLEGRILSIEPRSLVFQSGDKKFRVALGQSLRTGKELDASAAASSESPISERRGSSPPG